MTTPTADLQNLNQTSPLVELYTLDLTPITGTVYRFTNHPNPDGGPLVFGGQSYQPLPVKSEGWDFSSTGSPPKPTLTVSNVTRHLLADVISLGDLVGAEVTRVRTFAKYLDAASFTRRNLLNYSEDLRNTTEAGSSRPWVQYFDSDITVSHVSTADPLGRTSLVSKAQISTTGTIQRQLIQAFTGTDNTIYTVSAYVKAAEVPMLALVFQTKATTYPVVNFTLATGTIYSQANIVGAGIEDAGDGWYRVWAAANTLSGAAATNVNFMLRAANGANYSGSVGDGVYIWGAQVEQGSSPTPYQQVLASSHQPFTDSSKYIGPEVYVIEQKTGQNNEFIQFQLTSILDRFGLKLPRRQVLKDKGFPGVARTRVSG